MVLCTVAIPTYNREDMIAATLKSVLAQSLDDMEVLVIDDRSQDHVFEVASSFRDPRLQVLRNDTNVGLFGNFNRCIELSQGKYLRILCNDDRLTPECLAREVAVMEANPSVSLLFSKGECFTVGRQSLGEVGNHFPSGIFKGTDGIVGTLWFFAHYGINPITLPSGVLLRKSACEQAGWFDTAMKMDGDLDYFLRVLEHGDLAVLEAIGAEISVHGEQMSALLEGDPDIMQENFQLFERHVDLLKARGYDSRLTKLFAAFTYLLSIKLRQKGLAAEGREYRQVARRYCSNPWLLLFPAMNLMIHRALLKGFGIRRLPIAPERLQ